MTRDRGQTTLDFLIGISTFLLVVGLAFTMVPGIVEPFAGSRSATPLVADSAADRLAQEVLAEEADPHVLNTTAMEEFFDGSEASVREDLALGPQVSVNVTLDGPSVSYRAVGDTPTDAAGSVYAAWRVVSVDGEQADLRVRVW